MTFEQRLADIRWDRARGFISEKDARLAEDALRIEVKPLHVLCSWCQRVIQEGDQSKPVSHGICHDCMEKALDVR